MPGPLSNDQKAKLCILAREAYDKFGARATGDDFETWRRNEQCNAVGISSLRACTQAHYNKLKAHFQDLAGQSGRAMNTHMRDQTEPRRVAEHKLVEECKKASLTLAYADAICRAKYKCHLDEATPKQLWGIVYDIRQRSASKRGTRKPKLKPPQISRNS